jgi:hypothetical protein
MTIHTQIEVNPQIPHGQINLAAVSISQIDCLYCKREFVTATDIVTSSCGT